MDVSKKDYIQFENGKYAIQRFDADEHGTVRYEVFRHSQPWEVVNNDLVGNKFMQYVFDQLFSDQDIKITDIRSDEGRAVDARRERFIEDITRVYDTGRSVMTSRLSIDDMELMRSIQVRNARVDPTDDLSLRQARDIVTKIDAELIDIDNTKEQLQRLREHLRRR